MKFRFSSVLLLILICSFSANSQFIGFTSELDTVFFGADTPTLEDPFDPEGELEFYGAYKIYANFLSPDDALSALYADVFSLNTPSMFIDAPCGCHNPVTSSYAMDATNPSALWIGPFMDLEYDTYMTIGMGSSDAIGFLPQTVGLPSDGSNICNDVIDNGSIFSVAMPQNAVAGDDLKVLVAQVTTCGHFTFSACVQVFVNGVQEDIQYDCPGLLNVTHVFDDGECVNDADGDGICDEFEIIGCMEEDACNFDPEATDNTGGCDYSCYGCTDPFSCNYNEESTIDDGTCEYTSCAGCTDPVACNFNLEAWLEDGTCEYTSCAGCTDPLACNYEEGMTIDDGTCILPGDSCDDGEEYTYEDFIQEDCSCTGYGCDDLDACNYNPNAIPDPSSCNYITLYSISGEAYPNAIMLLTYLYPNTSGSTYEWTIINGDIEDGEGTNLVEVAWWGNDEGTLCVTETNSGGCSGEQVCLDVDITPVNLDELGFLSFLLYPSPASTTLNIKAPSFGSAETAIQIRDASGRVVHSSSISSNTSIDVSHLARGAYLVKIISEGQYSSFQRVILH
ncbi:MAG: hypothetical protein CL847_00280 [Crocinitomicaceae bacterium]|nr:hypothetical protein [Crocinitomicaceae bacterium]